MRTQFPIFRKIPLVLALLSFAALSPLVLRGLTLLAQPPIHFGFSELSKWPGFWRASMKIVAFTPWANAQEMFVVPVRLFIGIALLLIINRMHGQVKSPYIIMLALGPACLAIYFCEELATWIIVTQMSMPGVSWEPPDVVFSMLSWFPIVANALNAAVVGTFTLSFSWIGTVFAGLGAIGTFWLLQRLVVTSSLLFLA